MKKKFVVLVLIILNFSGAFAKDLFISNGKITNTHTNGRNDSEYSLCVSTSNNNSVVVNGYVFVSENDLISITYDEAFIAGGDKSSSSTKKTNLEIIDSNGNEIDKMSFYVQKGNPITIRLVSEYYIGGNLREEELLASVLIFSDFIIQKSIEERLYVNINNNFDLLSCLGEINNNKYSLSVKAVVTGFDGDNESTWYAKKGTNILIDYTPIQYGSGGGGWSEEGGSSSYWTTGYTELRVNGCNCTSLPTKLEEDMDIKLVLFSANHSQPIPKEETIAYIKFRVKDIPSAPKQTGETILEGWSNKDVEVKIETEYGEKEIAYFEYSLDDKITWQKGSSYKTNVEDGYTLNQNIYFRVIDYVGNESEPLEINIRVDKTCPVISASGGINGWTKENVDISVSDTGSPCTLFINGDEIEGGKLSLSKEGVYAIQASDAAGNCSKISVNIDKSSPNISTTYSGGWTKEDVEIQVTDAYSGMSEVSVNNEKKEIQKPETTIVFSETGNYVIKAIDEVGNSSEKEIQIDKTLPTVLWGEVYYEVTKESDEKQLLNSFTIDFLAEDEHSGIKPDGFCLKRENEIIKTNTDNSFYQEDFGSNFRALDQTINYSFSAEDIAGNKSEEISKQIFIPREIEIQILDLSQESEVLKQTRLEEDFVTVGILLNKINFDNYSKIKLNRNFLGEVREDDKTREYLTLDKYIEFFDLTEDKEKVKFQWESLQQIEITRETIDIVPIEIDGKEYWFFEDKIPTSSGLGHKGIEYQLEWTWGEQNITERGNNAVIEKTANTPGILKVRLTGTNKDGTEKKYIVLDEDGNKIEEESDEDFLVPVNGEVSVEFKIEDKDFDEYDVNVKELLFANFINEVTKKEEKQEVEIVMEGCFSTGKIQSHLIAGEEKRTFCTEENYKEWNSLGNTKIKLYYNKPFNMLITMEEGYKGKNGNLKDVTKSSIINLMANNPDLGGFKLIVGEDAGYNDDGITARPHQEINLALETVEDGSGFQDIEWDFGDEISGDGNNVSHSYKQHPKRTGNTSEYVMKIKCVQNQQVKEATINVHIVDTQYGTLLGDEEWIGEHVILGKIQIPEGRTLTVNENLNDSKNETKVLVIGSSEEGKKGSIEVLAGGTFAINGNENNQIIFTEGRNGQIFSEVENDNESNKWDGFIVRNGAKFDVDEDTDVLIKYATIGLFLEKDSLSNINVLNIENASFVGIKNKGTLKANQIVICDTPVGLETSNSMSIGNIEIKNCKEGIICKKEDKNPVSLNIQNVDIEGNEYGEMGVFIPENFSLSSDGSNKFNISGFKKGILNEGIIEIKHGDVNAENCLMYGIKTSGKIDAKKINIKGQPERGIILIELGSIKAKKIEIQESEIGVHAFDTSELNSNSILIKKAEYGIKTEGTEKQYPKIFIDSFENEEELSEIMIDWYDCNEGPLKVEEIKQRELDSISLHNSGKE